MPAGPRKSDYLYTNFLPNFPPISIPFSKEKPPIWIKLGAFYNNLPKIHPIYVIWAPSSLMKTPRSLYQISRKSAPKGRHIYIYLVNVRTPRDLTDLDSKWMKSQNKSYPLTGRLIRGLKSLILCDMFNTTMSGIKDWLWIKSRCWKKVVISEDFSWKSDSSLQIRHRRSNWEYGMLFLLMWEDERNHIWDMYERL